MSIAAQQRLHANKHAVQIRTRIEVSKDGTIQQVLVIATDLQLNAVKYGYDDDAVRKLISDLAAALDDWDRGEIVPLN